MDYKKLSFGLGLFSLALGAAELFAAKKITRALDADGHERLVKGFGVREIATGVAVLAQPALSTGIWGRVAGDALDLAALGVAARNSPRNRAIRGALAFVVGATTLDLITARGLDRQTGKVWPMREHLQPA